MTKATIGMDIATPYCEQYKSLPSLTLARIVYKENPKFWPHLDACRQTIMRIRGKHGESDRVDTKYKGLFDEQERTRITPYALPKTWANATKVFKLPTSNNRIGFISDAEVPFQDNEAIECAYRWLKERDINTLFINGDWVDFYRLSNFEKDPRKRDFSYEYHCVLQSLEHMRHHFPKVKIYYNLDANHEIRYERYWLNKAPELLSINLPSFNLESFLKLNLFDIEPLRNNHHILIGKLAVLHGHTLVPLRGSRSAHSLLKSSPSEL